MYQAYRAAGHSSDALSRLTVQMIGSAIVTSREPQQLPPRASETTLVGQLTEPGGDVSVVLPIRTLDGFPPLVHR
jgi:hypothetical protein